MKLYRTTFTVRGAMSFPVDMLRYDSCYPHSQDAGAAILGTFYGRGELSPHSGVQVLLAHVGTDRNWQPTVDRWESFCWFVSEASILTEPMRGAS